LSWAKAGAATAAMIAMAKRKRIMSSPRFDLEDSARALCAETKNH
jgi:hypothetical protein